MIHSEGWNILAKICARELHRENAIKGKRYDDELDAELKRLKQLTRLGPHLELRWHTDDDSDRHGEVKGSLILIYDCVEEEALRTLRHEFLDHLISREIIEPLVRQINMQKRLIESLIYGRKEVIIERFVRLLDESDRARDTLHT